MWAHLCGRPGADFAACRVAWAHAQHDSTVRGAACPAAGFLEVNSPCTSSMSLLFTDQRCSVLILAPHRLHLWPSQQGAPTECQESLLSANFPPRLSGGPASRRCPTPCRADIGPSGRPQRGTTLLTSSSRSRFSQYSRTSPEAMPRTILARVRRLFSPRLPAPPAHQQHAIDNQQVTKRHTWGGPSPHLPAPPVQQHHTVSASVCMHPGGLLSPHCPCSSAQHDQDCGARPSEAWARPVTATCAAAAHSQQALPACRGICVAAAFVACQCCLQSLKLPCCRGRVQRQQADPAADMGGWLPIWLLSQWVLPTQERPEQVALVGQPAFALFCSQ